MMKFLFKDIIILLSSVLLVSCNISYKARINNIKHEAKNFGFTKKLVKGGKFWLVSYQRVTNQNLPFVFYIEGDGSILINKYSISNNPTPKNSILSLAALDERPNVVYIARPCQYFNFEKYEYDRNLNPHCNFHYWTDKRMSNDVVDAIDEVIRSISGGNTNINLIGYSGGGGVSILVAARNNNVKSIITIAGNLDSNLFCKYHNASMMLGSLNPIEYASQIKSIPQLHISGGHDKVVPPFIAERFISVSSSSCVHQEIVPEATHDVKCWKKYWPFLLKQMSVTCY